MKTEEKWELKMDKQRKLKVKGAEVLWERVKLLVHCYDDEEFRAWCLASETNELDFLDEELSDTAASFMTLRAVLAQYPTREEWVKHNIRELIAMVLDDEKKARSNEDNKRISWKERALAAEHEIERLRAEIETMRKTLEIFATAKK